MKRKILNIDFTTEISNKIPNKAKLINRLIDILCIEKEAIYRRLRGDVPFSFAEVAIISEHLGISLDEMVGIQSDRVCPFRLQLTNFETPNDEDFLIWNNYGQVIEIFKENPPFTISETWTTLPFPMCYKYTHLINFYLLKWIYQTNKNFPYKHFEDINPDRELSRMAIETTTRLMDATETNYIISENIISDFLKDLNFFCSIHLINQESKEWILHDLKSFLDDLEETAIKGEYPQSGQKFLLYISDVTIDTNYSLYESGGNCICMLRTLVLNSATTTDIKTYHYMLNWFTSQKRLSTLISVSGEKERMKFFNKQRELLSGVAD